MNNDLQEGDHTAMLLMALVEEVETLEIQLAAAVLRAQQFERDLGTERKRNGIGQETGWGLEGCLG